MKKKSNKKELILLILLILVSLGSFIFKTKNIEMKVINNSNLDNELVAVRIKNDTGTYEKAKNIPINGYILNNEESYCGVKQEDNAYSKEIVEITYRSGKVTINKVNKNGMKCFLYFDKAPCKGIACEKILANNSIDTSRSIGEFTSTFEEDTNGRIFKGPEDDYGEYTYFFAGKDPNNWVQFADKWWRIIRVNGDGSIRLIYAGSDSTKAPSKTGEDAQIGTSAFNNPSNDNAHVGYMYGAAGSDNYNDTHTNTNSSTIKGVLDTWYGNNIGNNIAFSSKIETNVGFCGDRTIATSSQTWWDGDTKKGYGAQVTAYIGWSRHLKTDKNWNSTQTASLKCNQTNDLYTVSTASRGNKALTYPIGLITADEVVFIGGFGGSDNMNYWLRTNKPFWTMSPAYTSNPRPYLFTVTENGKLHTNYTGWDILSARPVINLKADTQLTGTGTTVDPYVVV